MKLHQRHEFDTDAAGLWELFNSDAFESRLEEVSGVRMRTLEVREEGDIEVRTIESVSKKELPGFMASALGAKHLTYTQTNRLDRKANRLQWKVVPMALADKVTAEGTTVVTEQDGRSVREIEGEITVRIPLIGGRIEKAILQEVERSYDRAAKLAQQILAERNQA